MNSLALVQPLSLGSRIRLFTTASCIAATLIFGTTSPVLGVPTSISFTPPTLRSAPSKQISPVSLDKLPPEATETIELIERGGKFPYRQDGTVFGNRERRLPAAPPRTYREYTVPTPGSPTRGARRIITAPQRVYYYTGDHYRSFQRVVR